MVTPTCKCMRTLHHTYLYPMQLAPLLCGSHVMQFGSISIITHAHTLLPPNLFFLSSILYNCFALFLDIYQSLLVWCAFLHKLVHWMLLEKHAITVRLVFVRAYAICFNYLVLIKQCRLCLNSQLKY